MIGILIPCHSFISLWKAHEMMTMQFMQIFLLRLWICIFQIKELYSGISIQVDIQALAHAVELTRQGAVESLRFAKGDLFQAFQVNMLLNSHNF